ncbi:teichoic acid transporter [Adlercreutzia sp. R25]|uniref:Teichoic acid transporter n=1 Tax=Adlercreutzia shanghongiae TaxID=3111773 RepID=A0ABU6IX35_9ACTN|nr:MULTISPECIES: teichoic acid transporter [unclassified Adlercreutzia]MEC4272695.1 teichoic acid transporter [Adlercreutzia sp. R25]MEC4294405.1 teichoic acid transporter [Adlercreutzia sp. R22]
MTQEDNLRDADEVNEAALSPAEEARRRKASHSHGHAAGFGEPKARRVNFNPLAREPKSTVQIGDVRYFDGAELSRPLEMPPRVRAIMLAAMAVAAIIGCVFLGQYLDQIMNEPIRQQQALQENLARESSYDFPLLASLMPLSDEEVMGALTEAGYTLYERTPVGTDPDGGFEVIKLPADVSLEEAGLMYVKGIDKLSAADAVKLLKGAWTLTVSRKTGDDMRLRYADFASGTIEKAVQGAMQVEGLENAEVTDSGVDDSGNTYQTGVISTDNGTYNWRVSVIELDEVYDISGLPNTAFYVGIRFTAQA